MKLGHSTTDVRLVQAHRDNRRWTKIKSGMKLIGETGCESAGVKGHGRKREGQLLSEGGLFAIERSDGRMGNARDEKTRMGRGWHAKETEREENGAKGCERRAVARR